MNFDLMTVMLDPADIPGAKLKEPFPNIPSLLYAGGCYAKESRFLLCGKSHN